MVSQDNPDSRDPPTNNFHPLSWGPHSKVTVFIFCQTIVFILFCEAPCDDSLHSRRSSSTCHVTSMSWAYRVGLKKMPWPPPKCLRVTQEFYYSCSPELHVSSCRRCLIVGWIAAGCVSGLVAQALVNLKKKKEKKTSCYQFFSREFGNTWISWATKLTFSLKKKILKSFLFLNVNERVPDTFWDVIKTLFFVGKYFHGIPRALMLTNEAAQQLLSGFSPRWGWKRASQVLCWSIIPGNRKPEAETKRVTTPYHISPKVSSNSNLQRHLRSLKPWLRKINSQTWCEWELKIRGVVWSPWEAGLAANYTSTLSPLTFLCNHSSESVYASDGKSSMKQDPPSASSEKFFLELLIFHYGCLGSKLLRNNQTKGLVSPIAVLSFVF